ncbi:1-acyl-sn-glycerol-3-phosphate acyltransferase [Candidatus Dependentiae bacterium]|nr:MAG: 1-acyl-sn-glycerol-3-phosphate acyltransferase [Candidatus Dependentiae bacterium]
MLLILLRLLRSLLSYLLAAIILIIFAIPGTFFLLLPERWRFSSRLFYWWIHITYIALLKSTFLSITVRGAENIPKKPVIIVANHQSVLDVPLVGVLVGGFPHIWLAWVALYKWFALGLLIRRLSIPIDVSSLQKAVSSLRKAVDTLQKYKAHAMVFPEGQRNTDGKVHEFFSGFVLLARKTGRPVIPVRIFNINKVYPPGSFLAYWYPIYVVVGKPMYLQEGESDEVFKNRVYQWFLEQTER